MQTEDKFKFEGCGLGRRCSGNFSILLFVFFPMNQTNVWKSKKINKHSIFQLVKLHPANLVFNNAIHKLSKIQFWKKLFAIGFPNKHCNLTALPTLQVGVETVIGPIQSPVESSVEEIVQGPIYPVMGIGGNTIRPL